MGLACPCCRDAMREVCAPATAGYLLALDQCPRCGGIWCDRWEAFALNPAAAPALDGIDAAALHGATPEPGEPLRCPRCRARMARFRDPTLPADAHIERCRNCEGMWFNRGQLGRMKRRPAPTAPDAARQAARQAVATVLAEPGGPATGRPWPTVGNLDSAMQGAGNDPDSDLTSEFWCGAVWVAGRALLHLLLHI